MTEPQDGTSPLSDIPNMPEWLAQVATVLLDGAEPVQWADRVRHGVSLTVVHDWLAASMGPVLVEASTRHGGDPEVHEAVRALHARAAAGERVAEDVWSAALLPALREVYRHAYAYEQAYATASAAARSFALSRGYDERAATEYGESYAKDNTETNARAHADAGALANSAAIAAAFAAADPAAYARTYPFAYVKACVGAYAGRDEERRREVCARLADGLTGSLSR
jgi:hypothetical protein